MFLDTGCAIQTSPMKILQFHTSCFNGNTAWTLLSVYVRIFVLRFNC